MAHWLWMRFGVSDWKARRWMDATRTLESLPLLSQAFASGEIGIDKVVELTRFATPRDRIRPHLLGSPGLVRGNPAQGGSPRPVPAGDAGCRAQPFAVLVVLRRGKALRTGGRASRLRRSGGGSGPPAGCGVLANEPRRGRCVVGRQTSGCPGGTGFCPDRLRPGSGSGDRGDPRVARGPDLWTGWRRGRGRRGRPRRDGPTLAMLGQAANDAGGREGPADQVGPPLAGTNLGDDACASLSGPRVSVPGMRGTTVHPCPPHHVVGARRQDRPGQSAAGVLVPSPPRSRAWVGGEAPRRRHHFLVPSRRNTASGGPRSARRGRVRLMAPAPSASPPSEVCGPT
jgi:hypothetical protein